MAYGWLQKIRQQGIPDDEIWAEIQKKDWYNKALQKGGTPEAIQEELGLQLTLAPTPEPTEPRLTEPQPLQQIFQPPTERPSPFEARPEVAPPSTTAVMPSKPAGIDTRELTREEYKPIGVKEKAKKIAENWERYIPFSLAGVHDTAQNVLAIKRLEKKDYPKTWEGHGQQTKDQERIENYLNEIKDRIECGETFGAQALEGLAHMVPWAVEFIMTGGVFTAGKEVAQKSAEKLLGKVARTFAGRQALRVAGWASGSLARTASMPHRVAENILTRKIPKKMHYEKDKLIIDVPAAGWATAIAKGFGETYIEVASESAGEAMTKGLFEGLRKLPLRKLPFSNKFIGALRKSWLKMHPNKTAIDFTKKALTKVGYHGMLGEFGEERLATLLHVIAKTNDFGAGENANVFERLRAGISQDISNLPVELTVLSVPMMAGQVMTKVVAKKLPVEPPPEITPEKPVIEPVEEKIEVEPEVKVAPSEIEKPPTKEAPTWFEAFESEHPKLEGKAVYDIAKRKLLFPSEITEEMEGEAWHDNIIEATIVLTEGVTEIAYDDAPRITASPTEISIRYDADNYLIQQGHLTEVDRFNGIFDAVEELSKKVPPNIKLVIPEIKYSGSIGDFVGEVKAPTKPSVKAGEEIPKELELVKLNPKEKLVKEAIKYFDTTEMPREAGYILENGEMLDFSGKNMGGTPGEHNLDHREVSQIIDEAGKGISGNDAMEFFEKQGNAIRIFVFKSGDVAISLNTFQKPTQEQLTTLRKIIKENRGATLSFDVYNERGQAIISKSKDGYLPGNFEEYLKSFYLQATKEIKPAEVKPPVKEIPKELEPLARSGDEIVKKFDEPLRKAFKEKKHDLIDKLQKQQNQSLKKQYKPIIDKVDEIDILNEGLTCVNCPGGAKFVDAQVEKAIPVSKTGKWAKKISEVWAHRLKDYDTSLDLNDEYLIFTESAIENFYKLENIDFYHQSIKKAPPAEVKVKPEKLPEVKPTEKIKEEKVYGGPPLPEPVKDYFKESGEQIQDLFVPAGKGREAKLTASILRKKMGKDEQNRDRLWESSKKREYALDRAGKEFNLKLLDNSEKGLFEPEDMREFATKNINANESSLIAKENHRKLENVHKFDEDTFEKKLAYIENYFPHTVWKHPEKAKKFFSNYIKKIGKPAFMKQRFYNTVKAGLDAGLELKTWNLEEMMKIRIQASLQQRTLKEALETLKSKGLLKFQRGIKASEPGYARIDKDAMRVFYPTEVPAWIEEAKTKLSGNAEGLFNALTMEWKDISTLKKEIGLNITDFNKASNELYYKFHRLIEGKNIKTAKAQYRLGEATKGMVVVGDWIAPTPAARVINNWLSPSLWGRQDALGKTFRGFMIIKNCFVAIKLGLSGFHAIETGLTDIAENMAISVKRFLRKDVRGGLASLSNISVSIPKSLIMGGRINRAWYKEAKTEFEKEAKDFMIRGDMRPVMSSQWRIGAIDNLRRCIRRKEYMGASLQLLPSTLEAISKPLMYYWVPRLKMYNYYKLCKDYVTSHPNISSEEMDIHLCEISDGIDNRFGQLVYDNLFWNKIVKDLGVSLQLSMGWNMGTIRDFGGSVIDTKNLLRNLRTLEKGEGVTERMAFIMAYVFTVGSLGALMTWAMTGDRPKELLDYFYPRTGNKNPDGSDERLLIPAMTKDIFKAKELVKRYGVLRGTELYIRAKLNPMLKNLSELYANEDFYGVQIRDPNAPAVQQAKQLVAYLLKATVPISVHAMMRQKQIGYKKTSFEKIAPIMGFVPAPTYITKTEGQKIIGELVRQKFAGRVQTKEQWERGQKRSELRKKIYYGTIKKEELEEAKRMGVIKEKEFKEFVEEAKWDSDIRLFKMLSTDGQEKVLSKVNPEERLRYLPYKRIRDLKTLKEEDKEKYKKEIQIVLTQLKDIYYEDAEQWTLTKLNKTIRSVSPPKTSEEKRIRDLCKILKSKKMFKK